PSTKVTEPGLRRIDSTPSATGVVLSATTPAKARGSDIAMKHCGQAANMTQEVAPTWVCAMITRTTMQATYIVPRRVSRSAAMAGRPTRMYSGTMATRAVAATSRALSDSDVLNTITRVAARTTAK